MNRSANERSSWRNCPDFCLLLVKLDEARSSRQLAYLKYIRLGLKSERTAGSRKNKLKRFSPGNDRVVSRVGNFEHFCELRYVCGRELLRRTFYMGKCQEWQHGLSWWSPLPRKLESTDSLLGYGAQVQAGFCWTWSFGSSDYWRITADNGQRRPWQAGSSNQSFDCRRNKKWSDSIQKARTSTRSRC